MICKKGNNFIFKNNQDMGGGYILPLKTFVICKTASPSCFSYKIDILCVAPFLQNRGHVNTITHFMGNIHTNCTESVQKLLHM
jgi:hypothetical protein